MPYVKQEDIKKLKEENAKWGHDMCGHLLLADAYKSKKVEIPRCERILDLKALKSEFKETCQYKKSCHIKDTGRFWRAEVDESKDKACTHDQAYIFI